jgi:hypothetical protein
MTENVAWSVNAGSPGGSIDASGSLALDAVTTVSVAIDAQSNEALDLQLADISKLSFLAITASAYDGTVKVAASGAGATEVALTGPLILFGASIGLLGSSLATLTLTNDAAASVAEVHILIGSKLL